MPLIPDYLRKDPTFETCAISTVVFGIASLLAGVFDISIPLKAKRRWLEITPDAWPFLLGASLFFAVATIVIVWRRTRRQHRKVAAQERQKIRARR